MNANKCLATVLTALLAAGTGAAQEISTSLPLTSVGDRLMWTVGDQNLNLDVPLSGRVRLELYSPRVDQGDYRSDTYYGDEQYDANRNDVTTTFTLVNEAGVTVLSRTFTPGEHAWETLLDQELPAGRYRLQAVTSGNGKNTFAVRLAGISAAISAERLSVNVHSRDWVPALNVQVDGDGHVLRLYDGDGPRELEARLRDEQGNTYPLAVSADLSFSDLPLPAVSGNYTVELRQPATAKQFSNTVGFSLTRAGAPVPLGVARVDQTGLLRVTAELVLPGGTQPTQVGALVGQTSVTVDGTLEQRVPAGTYAVTPDPVPGAEVTVASPSVTVPRGGSGETRIQVRPQVDLSLDTDKQELCVGDTVTFTARAATAYAGELPLTVSLDAPGLDLQGVPSLDSTLSAARPGELRLSAVANRPGPVTVTARLAPWTQARTVTLNVRADATPLQLTREPLPSAQPGSEVTVALRVRNTAAYAVPFLLTDTNAGGLEALESPTFSGTLAAGEARTLSYRARVTGAEAVTFTGALRSPECAATQTVGGALAVQPVPAQPATPEPTPAPEARRASTVSLPFDAPVQARELVVAHRVPQGAEFVAGSSRVNGQALPDPVRGPSGTLYWVLPRSAFVQGEAAWRGTVTYDLAHTGALGALDRPALLARYAGERREVLEGELSEADLAAAQPLNAPAAVTENPGAIKFPLQGSLIRIRDRINVLVNVPAGQDPSLSVNGQPVGEDRIGQVTTNEDGSRLVTFVGVPLRAGQNTLQAGADTVTVQLVGATARVDLIPVSLVADGSTPLRLKVRALDAAGNLTDQDTVTLNASLEPRVGDADPASPGYQVRLKGGEGELVLQPQAAPTTLSVAVALGQAVTTTRYDVRPDSSRVGVGLVSATLGLDGNLNLGDDLTWQARASYEGPLAGGKLYVAADKDGLPTDQDTLKRFSLYGDSSVASVPLQGADPVALRYDHPSFQVAYRRSALPIDVLPVGEQLTALTASTKGNVQLSGFAALVPGDRISGERLVPENTRLLRLGRTGISLGSETLEVVTLEKGTGKELRRVPLARNVDYILDTRTGVITLTRALDRVDADLNDVVVLASYRLESPLAGRTLAAGAQAKYVGEGYAVGVAAVSLDGRVTTGARATYDNGTLRADGLLAYSGGLQASADLGVKLERTAVQARVRYQDSQYQGLAPFAPGLTLGASVDTRLTDQLSASVQAEYARTAATQGGSVTARADYRLAPFSVGAGLRAAYGTQSGLGAVLSAGYHQSPIDVDVTHVQPLSGNLDPVTTVTAKYAVSDTLSVGLSDEYNWKTGHRASLSLNSTVGTTNYQVAYDLPAAGGQGNRARFGVSTALPLSERLTAGLRGSALYDVNARTSEFGAGVDLLYKADRFTATTGTDLTLKGGQMGVVLRGGLSGQLSDHLTLSADGLGEFGAGKSGVRAAVGYAYRNRTFNSLGTVRYVNGSLAGGQPELSSNFAAEYRQPTWAARAGLDTRTLLADPGSFTAQLGLGATYYVTDRIGLGAWGRTLTQPSSGTAQYGYGLEASFRALPGTWITAGYNPAGFTGLGNAYTKQGAYLRLDLTLDETLGGEK
ncbi:DUF11 domain-containing protein [Deinococcus multiflagellatus]|uniref:DUF11 domain-containing protein n=1 Tax=Deinococcus multiflagellatus TaxID=1656887 RepID=A0ABW1ZJ40_9DEIO|nr:DUF11 domain-containing protein [Deinococcus multiflagellatus]MBZ9712400.1 DUF11 domain-containing protein [Deinococcus multiflagellatus]